MEQQHNKNQALKNDKLTMNRQAQCKMNMVISLMNMIISEMLLKPYLHICKMVAKLQTCNAIVATC